MAGLCEGGNEPAGSLKPLGAEGRKRVTRVEPTELFAHAPQHNLWSRNIELFPSLRTSSVNMEQQPQGSYYELDLCKVEVDDFDQHVIRDTIEEFYRVQKVVHSLRLRR
ncbi:hypothetical protein ANN_17235 [Periplaneta americana]|uniref:Uncharacterized protein n=1 Tax=Periplaneta americana TaxID=6978 RepID=A0ABQ8SUG6_PERAM|nr:hypothetical protein ANN_17235 [Periplaneta americana]